MKPSSQIVAKVLAAQSVRHAVVSPGSRNAPMLMALDAEPRIALTPVIDERSAAFIALGMAQVSRVPVALCCTSGTAMLNYGPALAEAYYQGVPLIVLSADRPYYWIDQDDSQTMRQPGALSHFVKASYDIPEFTDGETQLAAYAARVANDACLTAMSGRPGPVHVNMQFSEPLSEPSPRVKAPSVVTRLETDLCLPSPQMKRLAEIAKDKRILVVAAQCPPSNRINRAVALLSHLPNVAVWTESIANIHTPDVVECIDRTLLAVEEMSDDEREALRPDVVISFGGALVSRMAKSYLRACPDCEHWSVGYRRGPLADPFLHLSLSIETDPAVFLSHFAQNLCRMRPKSDYARLWHRASELADKRHKAKMQGIPWSLLQAMGYILPRIPKRWNLQLSNGTTIRYAQLFSTRHLHASYCNRGVSGIDGCTSTALGASLLYPHPTLLITGDMSFAYDIGALAARCLSPELKIILLNNHGGGIFRFISSTSALSIRERYFAVPPALPLRQLCAAYGIDYYRADSARALKSALQAFLAPSLTPALLDVDVDEQTSAATLRTYFGR